MKERVAALVGPVAHQDVGVHLPLGLRASCGARRPCSAIRSSFSIYDQADAVRLVDYVRRDLDLDPKRFPPRRLHSAISAMKNELVSAEQAVERAFTPAEKRIADVYREYQRRLLEASALDFDDLLTHGEAVPRARRRVGPVAGPVPSRARRRVPRHQRRAVGVRAHALRRAPQRDGGRRHKSMARQGTLVRWRRHSKISPETKSVLLRRGDFVRHSFRVHRSVRRRRRHTGGRRLDQHPRALRRMGAIW